MIPRMIPTLLLTMNTETLERIVIIQVTTIKVSRCYHHLGECRYCTIIRWVPYTAHNFRELPDAIIEKVKRLNATKSVDFYKKDVFSKSFDHKVKYIILF